MAQLSTLVNDINSAQTIEENVYKLAECVFANFKSRGYTFDYEVLVKKGRKYWKIITDNSVHCFVDVKNGNVFKPTSWNKPAPIVRYNLLTNPEIAFSRCDCNGSYLYIR